MQMHLHAPGPTAHLGQPCIGWSPPVNNSGMGGNHEDAGMWHRRFERLTQAELKFEHAQVPPAEQGQCAMRWNGSDRFSIGVIVTKFFFLRRLLPLDDRRRQNPFVPETGS